MALPTLMPTPRTRFVDNAGLPLANGMVFTFAAGTSDKLATYQDPDGLIPHENPIRLDIRGEALIYWLGTYKVDVRTSLGIQLQGYPVDNFQAINAADAGAAGSVTVFSTLAANNGGNLVSFKQSGAGAALRTIQDKARELPSITDYYLSTDGGDYYNAINRALAAHKTVYVPPGTFPTSAGSAGRPSHVITGKCLVGQSREASIIQATGTNEGRTLFVNDKTDYVNPGIWGTGKEMHFVDLYIRGNWDVSTGLQSVSETTVDWKGVTVTRTGTVGVLKASYTPAQSALVKGVSGAYVEMQNCYVDNAWEHGVVCFRLGYSGMNNNIYARCRGSGLWLTADSAANSVTSSHVHHNQFVANRGGYGGLRTTYTYGVTFNYNTFEDNTWGATFGEGADTDISYNYFEQNPLGDADVSATLWGLTMFNNYWTIPPVLPKGGAARGFMSYDRKQGLHHLPVRGLDEGASVLGPLNYSSLSDAVGFGTPAAIDGTGATFQPVPQPSTDPNTLDGYYERVLIVTDGSGAGLAFSGGMVYTQVGRLITVTGQLVFPTTASSASVKLSGLPYPVATGSVGNVSDNAGLGASSVYAAAGGTSLSLFAAGTFTERTNLNFSGKVLFITITYTATF